MTTYETTWRLGGDGALKPDFSGLVPPEGMQRGPWSVDVPAGHTPEPGEAVTVTLAFVPVPPPPPEPPPEEPPAEPTP